MKSGNFKDTFATINIKIDDDALDLMTKYSSGVPLTMQQIGDSTFWNLTSNRIKLANAKQAIIEAANELRNRQIRKTLNSIKSDKYEKILLKIAKNEKQDFTKNELKKILSEEETDMLDKFITKMLKIELLQEIEDLDENQYQFYDNIYYTYYHIKANEKEIMLDNVENMHC